MKLRSERGSPPPSRTARVSTTSATYSSRSRSSDSNDRSVNGPAAPTNQTRSALDSNPPPSDSQSMWDTSPTRPSPADETPANWPNGSDASLTGGHYSTPRTTAPETNLMPSNYSPPSTSPMTAHPRAFPAGSSTPSPAHQRPF